MPKDLYISQELMEELDKVFGKLVEDDLKKNEFERGILYGQMTVLKKLQQWKEAHNGR